MYYFNAPTNPPIVHRDLSHRNLSACIPICRIDTDFFCRWQEQFQGLLVELSRLQRQEREVVFKLLITRLLTTYEEVSVSS